ncbi:MAG: hypothetical protein E6Q90_00950 [Actinobacteria bacterium]|nr:MAG: hypothetical protein E6Q90_00950 [Actinomycetota bacterium]
MQSNNFTFGNSTPTTPPTTGVQMVGTYGPMSFDFSGNYSVTEGQPWNGVTGCQVANGTSGTAANCEINVQAGRHNSAGPAQFFAQNVSAALCSWECGGSMPSNLNFAITGTITIGGTSYPITLGQGSPSGGEENWWWGGPGWQVCQSSSSELCTPDGAWSFSSGNEMTTQSQTNVASTSTEVPNTVNLNSDNGTSTNAPPVMFTYSGDSQISAGGQFGSVTDCPTPVMNCAITINASRNKTTPVAQWFTANAPVAQCTGLCNSTQPSQLNFAITGTLTIGSKSYPLTLGQGSSSPGVNNWWFGGPGWTSCDPITSGTPGICTPDGAYGLQEGNTDPEILVAVVSPS